MIAIDRNAKTPVYRQIVERVLADVREGRLRKGDSLPSLNRLADDCQVSRDTAAKAYALLRRRGVLHARHGKEFYILSDALPPVRRCLLVMDEANMYKRRLAEGLREGLAAGGGTLDVFLHNFSANALEALLGFAAGSYDAVAVVPTPSPAETAAVLAKLPAARFIAVDQDPGVARIPSVGQDFVGGTFAALMSGRRRLARYAALVLADGGTSRIVQDIAAGAERFARKTGMPFRREPAPRPVRGEVLLTLSDENLVLAVQAAARNRLVPGRDFGLISYNDTPFKEIVAGGVATISVDFYAMGLAAAQLLLHGGADHTTIPTRLSPRSSLGGTNGKSGEG
jgi:DNA-binding transcriptional regulator YhcF (GntR family)